MIKKLITAKRISNLIKNERLEKRRKNISKSLKIKVNKKFLKK